MPLPKLLSFELASSHFHAQSPYVRVFTKAQFIFNGVAKDILRFLG